MRRKNMTTKVKKTVALFMATALVLGCGAQHVAVKADQTTAGGNRNKCCDNRHWQRFQ